MRRSSSDSASPIFCSPNDFSHTCASGLMVCGIGIVRVMCAVPSASKVAESVEVVLRDRARFDWAANAVTVMIVAINDKVLVFIAHLYQNCLNAHRQLTVETFRA